MLDKLLVLLCLSVQAKEVVPDPELVRKLSWLCSPVLPPSDGSSGCPSSLELAYITDFFLALAICNSVVVSSPSQPRHVVSRHRLLSTLQRLPHRSRLYLSLCTLFICLQGLKWFIGEIIIIIICIKGRVHPEMQIQPLSTQPPMLMESRGNILHPQNIAAFS